MTALEVYDYGIRITEEAAVSPFDDLKQRVGDSESWSARDLMPVMGYTKWEHFEVPINRAVKAAENMGVSLVSNFPRCRKITKTKPQADYRLSRFAAYLVAMNGDPNKPEVAAAQAYFAIRTREAEVALPLSGAELMAKALVEANRVLEVRENVIAQQSQELALAAPKVEIYDKFMDADGTLSWNNLAKVLGIGQNKMLSALRRKGVLIDGGSNHNTPYQSYAHHFKVVPVTYDRSGGAKGISYTTRALASAVPFVAKTLGLALVPA